MSKSSATSTLIELVASTHRSTNTVVIQKIFDDLKIRTTPSQDAIMDELEKTEAKAPEAGHSSPIGRADDDADGDSTEEDETARSLHAKRKGRSMASVAKKGKRH